LIESHPCQISHPLAASKNDNCQKRATGEGQFVADS
jgi:hypothetical protein